MRTDNQHCLYCGRLFDNTKSKHRFVCSETCCDKQSDKVSKANKKDRVIDKTIKTLFAAGIILECGILLLIVFTV